MSNRVDNDPPAVSRRAFLASAVGVAALSGTVPDRTGTGLDDVARSKHRRFGSAIAWGAPGADRASFANPAYASLVLADCGIVVPENEMKWQALQPSPTVFAFERCDAIVGWAAARGLTVRGHNLLWHQSRWLPAWLNAHDFGAMPAVEAERLVKAHIHTVVGRYGPRIDSWDVVNEAVGPADGALHETVVSRAMGGSEAVLDLAFRTAREGAPRAQLVYNDYMSWEPGNVAHRAGVLRLLEGFRRRGVPIDALGLQSHIATQPAGERTAFTLQQKEWRQFLDAVTAMGLDLIVTELDVRDNHLPADAAVRDRAVADYARAYLDVTLDQARTGDVLCWGLCDRYSWIEGLEPRADRAPRRPTPYDARFRAKPLREAIAAALAGAAPAAQRSVGAV